MSTDELVAATILKATGQLSTAVFGDDDYSKVLGYANPNIDGWAKEDEWNSLYDPAVNCGTISATDVYDLDPTIRVISNHLDDYIEIVATDGQTIQYETVPVTELKKYAQGKYCARLGSQLKFNKVFTSSDPEYGGTINVPAFLYAPHLAKANDTVPIDDPNWLVAMCAADWVQNDVTLAQHRPEYLAEAQDLLGAMKENNNGQITTVPKKPVTSGPVRSW